MHKRVAAISFYLFLLLFLSACPAINQTSLVSERGDPATTETPPPTSRQADNNSDGLVTVVITGDQALFYGRGEWDGFAKHQAVGGRITLRIPYGYHMINACNRSERFAVENNRIKFNLYVNGVRLTKIVPAPANAPDHHDDGMLFFYLAPNGEVRPTPP